jgi:hypothetical protein
MLHIIVMATALVTAQGLVPGSEPSQNIPSPAHWVPFSVQLKVIHADGSELPGRFFRDQHGCERQEIPTGPRRSTILTIKNFEKGVFYRKMVEQWTVQPMKLGPEGNVPHKRFGSLTKLPDLYEGFEVYEQQVPSHGPKGTTMVRHVLAPELNFYLVMTEMPVGRILRAHNIQLGPQDHSLFELPAGAVATERPGYGGAMVFAAVVLRVTFPGSAPQDLLTTEERASKLTTPEGDVLFVMTSVVDPALNRVRVTVLRDATGRLGAVRGTVLDEASVMLGGAVHTTKLRENFEISVVRISDGTVR